METAPARSAPTWYRDRAAWDLIALRYVPLLGLLNLLWESAQLPFYTLWREAPAPFIAYAVVHCTLGDMVIGTLALVLALIATRARALETWRWQRIALALVIPALGYTVLSEWVNTVARAGWEYSDLMPIVRFNGLAIGLSPLLQWLVIPPLALRLAATRRVRMQQDGVIKEESTR